MRTATAIIGIALVTAGCRKQLVHNVVRAPAGVSDGITMEAMTQALIAGGERAGWRVREVAPGNLRAEKVFNQHRALSEISYDTTSYSITLLSADNLLYDGREIHKRYNLWVEQLQKGIDDELRFRFQ